MNTCDNCGGEGGFEICEGPLSKWGDPTPGGRWVDCPTCGGSGWVDDDPPTLDMDELDERCGMDAPLGGGPGVGEITGRAG